MAKSLIQKPLLGVEAVEDLFEKALVGESGEIVGGLELVHERQRDPPRHPEALAFGQVPAAAEETLDDLDLPFGQRGYVSRELGTLLHTRETPHR